MKRVLILVITFLLPFTLISAYAEQKIPFMDSTLQEGKPYYSDIKRGWWWYEKAHEKEKKGEDSTLRGERQSDRTKHRVLPSLKNYTYGQLWNMHPDDFQPLLMDFQKKAVMSPTEENVREYYVFYLKFSFGCVLWVIIIATALKITPNYRPESVQEKVVEITPRLRILQNHIILAYIRFFNLTYQPVLFHWLFTSVTHSRASFLEIS
ncbi:MAG: conjugal transfer protein TraF [Nitrospirota bacterium]